MEIKPIHLAIFSFIAFIGLTVIVNAKSKNLDDAILRQTFDLAGERSHETQYFIMETKNTGYNLDGTRGGKDIYKLYLKCMPAGLSGKKGDEFTCSKFAMKTGDSPEITIPAINGWSYVFINGFDDKGQMFGIEHSKFEILVDNNGNSLTKDKNYIVYNNFVDFHTFCNVFAGGTKSGKSIQDLKKIGQKIVHFASFSEAPVNLGTNVAEGSTFKNGEATLEFKGLSIVNEKLCAVVGFDSGEGYFKMIMNLSPDKKMQIVGGSHYKGDIYIDISTEWIQKAIMDEIVVCEMLLPFSPGKINVVYERDIILRNVSEDEFKQSWK